MDVGRGSFQYRGSHEGGEDGGHGAVSVFSAPQAGRVGCTFDFRAGEISRISDVESKQTLQHVKIAMQ